MIGKAVEKIKNIRNSKDGKVLQENFIYLTVLQITSYVFPILTFPYLTRVLGVSMFGAVSFAAGVVVYFSTVIDWGFNMTSARDIAVSRESRERVSYIYSKTIYGKLLLLAISTILLSILTMTVKVFRENSLVIWMTFLMIPGHIFFPEWFFQGLERMKYTTILNFIIKLIFTGMVFLTIHSPEDYWIQPLLQAFGFSIVGIVATWIIVQQWGYRFVKVSFRECLKYIKESFDIFLNNLMPNLYISFSVLLLGFWGGRAANGILEGGNKFVTVSYQFLMIISRVFFPFLSRRPDKHHILVKIHMSVTLLCAAVLFIFAPWLINTFLSPEYEDSIIVLRLLSVSLVFMSLGTDYGANYLVVVHKERLLRNITIAVALASFLLVWPLIYFYSYIGAACAMLSGRTILGIATYICALKVKRELRK